MPRFIDGDLTFGALLDGGCALFVTTYSSFFCNCPQTKFKLRKMLCALKTIEKINNNCSHFFAYNKPDLKGALKVKLYCECKGFINLLFINIKLKNYIPSLLHIMQGYFCLIFKCLKKLPFNNKKLLLCHSIFDAYKNESLTKEKIKVKKKR